MQHHYHLKMGDVLIFAQKEDNTIVLAGRPPTKADAMKKPPVRRPSPTPGARTARRDQVGSRVDIVLADVKASHAEHAIECHV